MNLFGLVFAAGAVGPFAARVFLPAFATALTLRFGVHLPLVGHFGLLRGGAHPPAWFTGDPALIVLAVLAAVETFGQKNAEVRRALHEVDLYLKPALALLTTLGVISATDADFARHAAGQAGFADAIPAAVAAVGTWRVARARRPVVAAVSDHLDGTPLDHLLSWAEDAWAAVGPVVLLLFPVVMLALTGAAVGSLFLVRRRLAASERAGRRPCPQCGTSVYACAVACPACRRPVDRPAAVGFLGLSKPYPSDDPAAQPFALAERRRCPVCATHLNVGAASPCRACGDDVRSTPAFAAAYAAHVARRLPVALAVTFAVGLVPIVGLIAGVVYYRGLLVLPFAQYLPGGRRFLLRSGMGVLFLLLAAFQVIPLLGGFAVPAMAVVSFAAYRRAYLATACRPSAG